MALTKSDRTKLIDDMKGIFVTKEELGQAILDLVEQQLSKEDLASLKNDIIEFKSEILAAINKKDENDAAHQMLHNNIGEDVPKLKRDVKQLFEKLEIPQPAY